nr:unnamed protein product [Digitaria exilis]
MARAEKKRAASTVSAGTEKPAKSSDRRALYFAAFLVLADAALVALIIAFVPYTKIDWDAYMSQVDAFLEGERDYTKIEGDTGPLVYPAGFLYVYSGIKFLTGGQVFPAQILFGVLYIVNLSLVLLLYVKTEVAMSIKGVFFALLGAAVVQPAQTIQSQQRTYFYSLPFLLWKTHLPTPLR